MPIFREHRGGLAESLATCKIISTRKSLEAHLEKSFSMFKIANVEIEPYPDSKNNFDARIGWFTQIVTIVYEGNKRFVAGYLSEHF
jgi:hypothetical protein